GERRRAGPQVGWATGQLRRDHAGAQRVHSGEEGITPRRAALLGIVVGELRAFLPDAVDIRRFPDHQALPVATNASRASDSFRMTFMEDLLTFRLGRGRALEQPRMGSFYCRREQSLRLKTSGDHAGLVGV